METKSYLCLLYILQVLAVAISVVGVCLVAVYSNNCGNSSSSNSVDWTAINSTNLPSEGGGGGGGGGGGLMLSHVHRSSCSNEHSTPMGYVVCGGGEKGGSKAS